MKYETGVKKLKETEINVIQLREKLDRLIPEFEPEKIKRSSIAAEGMCL